LDILLANSNEKELATKRKTQRNSKKIKTEFKELLAVRF
jgi:hypothetical protein